MSLPSLLLLGPILSAFTSGTLASISLITIPALTGCQTQRSLLNTWHAALNSGVRVCPPLAILSTLVHLTNAYLNHNSASLLLVAAISTISIVPFTVFVLQGTNEALFTLERRTADGGDGKVEKETVVLMRKWARLNLVRAALPGVGAVVAGLALR